MFRISINKYTLIGISVLALLIFIIATYMFIAYIIHDRRKFISIDKYNEFNTDRLKTYNENQKDYIAAIEKSGVNSEKTEWKILKFNFLKRNLK